MKLLADYIFDEHLRYEAHELVYTGGNETVVFRGFLAASVMATLLSISDEGEARAITLDTDEGRDDFFRRYEKEVLADNGGLFNTEVQALNDAYLECTGDPELLPRICRNDRLLDLALGLTIEYMQRLVKELALEHIYDARKWTAPFAQWLFDAGFIETRRQRLLTIDWSDPAEVYALAEDLTKEQSPIINLQANEPTFVFDGLSAEQVVNGYWNWLWESVQKEAALFPDSKVRLSQLKQAILANELDYDFLKPEMKDFTPEQIELFDNWMAQWKAFVEKKIKPEKEITFWTKLVTDERQEALLDYLKSQERQPQRYKCLAVAVYSLRQLGYVTYNISPASIAVWLSARLQNDYSSKNGIFQFRRAWNELGRFNPAVKDEVERLAEFGVRPLKEA